MKIIIKNKGEQMKSNFQILFLVEDEGNVGKYLGEM